MRRHRSAVGVGERDLTLPRLVQLRQHAGSHTTLPWREMDSNYWYRGSRKPEPLPDNVQTTVSHDSEILKKICATCSNDREGRAQSKAKGLTRRSVG